MKFRVRLTIGRFQQYLLLFGCVHPPGNDRPSPLKYFLDRKIPEPDQAIRSIRRLSASREDLPTVGGDGQGSDRTTMPMEEYRSGGSRSCLHIPNTSRAIIASGQKVSTVGAEKDRPDLPPVLRQDNTCSCRIDGVHVPEPNRLVVTCSGYPSSG